MFNKFFKVTGALVAACMVTGFAASCNNTAAESVEPDVAYEELAKTVGESLGEVDQISISINGKINGRVYEENKTDDGASTNAAAAEDGSVESTSETRRLVDQQLDVIVKAQVTADENRKISGASVYINLGDPEKKPLIIEAYIKDGYSYTYTNLFGDSYSYNEAKEENFDLSGVQQEDIEKFMNEYKDRIPEPQATKSGDEYTIRWIIDESNIDKYVALFGGSDDPTGSQGNVAIPEGVKINESYIEAVLSGGRIVSVKLHIDIANGEETYKGDLNCEIKYSGVTVEYPEGRLEEIKAEKEKEDRIE